MEPVSNPLNNIDGGAFRGSRVVEATTTPDLCNGHATLQFAFRPAGFLPATDNLVFLQVFRRTARKADGFQIPILPSLYIEYAGSPELDLHTLNGATVDHKVGELDPYYNGRDLQDVFSGALEAQKPGHIKLSDIEPTRMVYHCRTYEEHWRALNPEGVREIQFDYETAAFCENGDGKGYYLGNLRWAWGKARSGPVRAWIDAVDEVQAEPSGLVEVECEGIRKSVSVYREFDPGQPSPFFSDVLALWLKNHKFAWPGRDLELKGGVSLTIPQPVRVNTHIRISTPNDTAEDRLLDSQRLQLLGMSRTIDGTDITGTAFPPDYFPFSLPIQVTFDYSELRARIDSKTLGVVRYDSQKKRYTASDLYILRKDDRAQTITFCTSRFGRFALVHRA
jgi:hypothetical protein